MWAGILRSFGSERGRDVRGPLAGEDGLADGSQCGGVADVVRVLGAVHERQAAALDDELPCSPRVERLLDERDVVAVPGEEALLVFQGAGHVQQPARLSGAFAVELDGKAVSLVVEADERPDERDERHSEGSREATDDSGARVGDARL